MIQFNQYRTNSIQRQLARYLIVPAARYVFTLYYILLCPVRYFRDVLTTEIGTYVEISDHRFRSRIRKPLYPIPFLAASATFVTSVIGLSFRHAKSLYSGSINVVVFAAIATICAFFMAIFLGKFRYLRFFVNYYFYYIGAIYFIFAALLLFFRLLRKLNPELNFDYLFRDFSISVGLTPILVFVIYLIAHPLLTFRRVLDANIYRLLISFFVLKFVVFPICMYAVRWTRQLW